MTDPSRTTDEPDPADAIPHTLVRVGAGTMMAAGALVAASGAQLFVFFTIFALWIEITAATMLVAGLAALPVGASYFQGRMVFGALGLAVGLALLSTGWLAYALSSALFSPIMTFASACSILAVLLVSISLPLALRARAAREALYGR